MIEHRFEIQARLEDGVTERRVDNIALALVTVCLTDEGAGEVSDSRGEPLLRPPVVSHLRSGEARALEFELLEPAERHTEAKMSPIEFFCNCVVAAGRVLRPFAGLRRGGLTDSTPEIGLLGAGWCGADASGAIAVCGVSRDTPQTSQLPRGAGRR